MEITITGKNTELLPNVSSYAVRKLDKINRLLPKILAFDVEIAGEKTKSPEQRFVVQVTVNNNGTLLRGEERGQDVFSAIDKVAEVMIRQVEHFKGKRNDKGRGGSTIRNTTIRNTTVTEPPPEAVETGEGTAVAKIVRRKRFDIKPMSIDEAADQMELLGHDFFLFRNSETEEVNLLYRRKDDNFGVIEVPAR